jgi:hypothetical protein
MFGDTVRSQHEPDSAQVIRKILDVSAGRISEPELKSYVRKRDKRLQLDIDSSQLNFFLLDILIHEFSDALFLLTIRDCYSWLDSFINDSLRRDTSREWIMLRKLRFRDNVLTHPPEERALKERGLYTLDGYLSYWANHNQKVISIVPESRLLIVKTNEITKSVYRIAEFSGLSKEAIQPRRSHSFENPNKYRILRKIDQNYLEDKLQRYCAPLMSRFFSEIKSMDDAGI